MPTVNTGMKSSFADTVGLKVDIRPIIDMLSPYDVPLLQWLPGLAEACTETRHNWLEDELVPHVSALAEADDGAELELDVTAGTGEYFRADDLIKIGAEVMLVSSVSNDTLTVVRGYGSTSPAAHDSGAVVTRIGIAKVEGAPAGEQRTTVKTSGYNFTQIFEDTVKVSGTRAVIGEHGVTNTYARELSKVAKQLAIQCELATVHGIRLDDGAGRRTFGGLMEFLAANTVDASAAALTRTTLSDMTHQIWRLGGSPRTLVMNIDQKQRLYEIYENQIRKSEGDRGLGGAIEYFENDLGRFDILLDRHMPRDAILVLDRSRLGFGPLNGRDWSHTYMGKTGDFDYGQVVGEFTMEVRTTNGHGIITNLAY